VGVAMAAATVVTVASTGVATAPPAGAAVPDVTTWTTRTGTDGRAYVADDQGRARQLRGFNMKTTTPAATATDELLALGQARGFDLMRLSVYWSSFEPTQGAYDEAYLDEVQTVLDRAAAHGILVVIDFHQDVYGPAFGDHGIPLWATRTDGKPFTPQPTWFLNYLQPAVQAAWEHLYEDADLRQAQIDAWKHVASRFHTHPALFGYDLLNEPFGLIRDGEQIFDAFARVQREQMTPMFQRLTDGLRTVDPNHFVLFEAPNVASLGLPISLGHVNGDKIIFFPHFYDPSVESATYVPGADPPKLNPEFFSVYEQATMPYVLANGYPTWFGEWGVAHPDWPGMDAFVASSLALMDRVGSGWTVFNWCKGSGYCPLDGSGSDRPNIGQIVRPWARAIAGAPTSFTFDPASKRLIVVFRDGGAKGTTDLFVPTGFYAGGHQVTTTDVDGSWSSSFDAGTGVLSVQTPVTGGDHAICLDPVGTTAPCVVPVAVPVTTTTAAPTTTTTAAPAVATTAVTPAFTG